MKLSEKKGGDFQPHPETEAPVKAVIVDVTPPKKRQTEYGERDEFRLVFETEVKRGDGTPQLMWSRGYTPSLNEKANFRKDLRKIMGRDLTAQELDEFDTESLVGVGAKLMITHQDGRDGKVYANIALIMPDKEPLKPSGGYVRVKDREEKPSTGGASAGYRNVPKAAEDEGRQPWQKAKVHVGKHAGVDLGDLDQEAVGALLEKWLPKAKAEPKPKADDKRLIAALEEVQALMADLAGGAAEENSDY